MAALNDLHVTRVAELTEFAMAIRPVLILAVASAVAAGWQGARALARGTVVDRLSDAEEGGPLAAIHRALDQRLNDGGGWSGPAFDRCAVLALPLPILCLLLAWIAFGWADPLGGPIGLRPQAEGWKRAMAACGIAIVLLCYGFMRSGGLLRRLAWGVAAFVLAAEITRILAGPSAAEAAAILVAFGAVAVECSVRNPAGLASPGLGLIAAAIGGTAGIVLLHAGFGMAPEEATTLGFTAAMVAGYLGLLAGHVAWRAGRLGLAWCVAWPLAILASLAILRLGARAQAPYPTLTLFALVTLLPLILLPVLFMALGLGRALRRRVSLPATAPLQLLLSVPLIPVAATGLYLSLLVVDVLANSVGNVEVFEAADMLDTLRLLPTLVAFASLHMLVLTPLLPGVAATSLLLLGLPGALRHRAGPLRAADTEGGAAAPRYLRGAMLITRLAASCFLATLAALLLAGGMIVLLIAVMPTSPASLLNGLEALGMAFIAWALRIA